MLLNALSDRGIPTEWSHFVVSTFGENNIFSVGNSLDNDGHHLAVTGEFEDFEEVIFFFAAINRDFYCIGVSVDQSGERGLGTSMK
jgi:hypothetical protein